MINHKADEVIKDVFESHLSRYQIVLETSMKDIYFIFDSVNLLYYIKLLICHKINLNCCGSCIDSPDWIKNKKATINPINDDDKCFYYTATVTSNHEKN